MAACSFTPLNPTATDAADIIMGPQRKRITIPIVALFVPQAIIRGWRAMNNPAICINMSLSKYHFGFSQGEHKKLYDLEARFLD
jgi:hypothetical protein